MTSSPIKFVRDRLAQILFAEPQSGGFPEEFAHHAPRLAASLLRPSFRGNRANERPCALAQFQEAFLFEGPVSLDDRCRIDSQFASQLADRREGIARAELACRHGRFQPEPDLLVQGNGSFRIEVSKHGLGSVLVY